MEMVKEYLSFEDVMDVFKQLAVSQGLYGRILKNIKEVQENNPEGFDEFKETIENQKFKDKLDVVMWVEG